MNTYTAGMLKTFLDCPEKYNYIFQEHLDIPSDDSSAVMGKKVHALINYFFNGNDISKMLKTLELPENKELLFLWKNFSSFDIKDVINSEYTFYVLLNSQIKLNGRVDAIRKNDDFIEILDWKTGNSKNINPESDMQTMVYMYSIYKLFNNSGKINNPENLSMSYYFLKEKTIKTVTFSYDKYLEYEKFIFDTVKNIEKYHSDTISPSQKCLQCSYNFLCMGAYEGLNDMI